MRSLHDARISPHDLSPQNLLVTREAPGQERGHVSLYLVDLDDTHVRGDLGLAERGRSLVQLGNLPEGHISTTDLLRALRAYAGGDATLWSRAWIGYLREPLLEEHLRVVVRRAAGGELGSAGVPPAS